MSGSSSSSSSTSKKRSRVSLACIQCRKRKVKCDFTHPQCSRCTVSGLPCAYADSPPRVDSQAFDQLGNDVVELHQRMKRVESELSSLLSFSSQHQINHTTKVTATWKLSLTPSGIRINTNITNINDLYHILLQGIARLEINNKAWINVPSFVTSHSHAEALSIVSKHPCLKTETPTTTQNLQPLVLSCYQPCFLPYQIVDQRAFLQKYHNPQSPQELLLVNSIHAWVAKHASIYHPTTLCNETAVDTAGESYFLEAKQLLRRCFTISNATTIHALLNLYMYQLSCERTTLAYLYIGLAIRMAEDLGLHKRGGGHTTIDLKQQEINKRLWWSVYWLDLCAALESNRPTMVDDKDCDIEYPARLEDEDQETGYRISFSVASIKLMKIRKAIAKHLPSERKSGSCLLDAVAHLESRLTQWLQELPHDLSFSAAEAAAAAAAAKKREFRDEASLILNIQYHTTWIMLHKLFLNEQEIAESPVALLSLDVCIRSARLITQLLQIYAKQPHWCHFYYCLDGVVESVSIHQKSASCVATATDAVAKQTALDHLATTMQILLESPLNYMQRVKDVIDQVGHFLEQHDQKMPLQLQPQPQQDICQAWTTERILLRHPNVNIMDFIQPTFSNEELNQILSIYNDECV